MESKLTYSLNVPRESPFVYNKTIEWIKSIKGEITEETESSIKVINYHTWWGKSHGYLDIFFAEENGDTIVTFSFDRTYMSWVFFKKYSNLHHYIMIESYYRVLDVPLSKGERDRLYHQDMVIESLIGGIFFSVVFIVFSYAGLLGFFDFYPHPGAFLFGGLLFVMLWLGYPFFRTLKKTISIMSWRE